ncbi:CAP domain-containing protein [Maritimibacter dapengensis]|uniref:CAP domain-containing protein n=1 Tax=Maritimibacter dapengensis TaxID=2836868 RepID=A0ABS6T3F7_9RHOB|nr:CAP domain-containing protein [Maritimibacter dapengensis]MBV7378872.1 CAP domain-containing protein [Maritimibacter dapengensis]
MIAFVIAMPAAACDLPPNGAALLADAGSQVNEQRRNSGRKALRRNARLDQAAQRHACWIGLGGDFGHTGAGGSKPSERISATGYRSSLTSENIAMGQRSARQVVSEWMGSRQHRDNLLRNGIQDYGVGVALLQGRLVWVMVYAAPR